MVPGDAAATARNITAAEPMFRMSILLGFTTLVMFLFLVALLYKLFEGVDKGQARLMVLLVCTGVAVALANLLFQFAPLVLLGGGDYLSVFTKPQLNALALGFLRLHSNGSTVATGFWGLWLFPFGILVFRSGFIPRVLGILLMVAGSSYVVSSAMSIGFPEYRQMLWRLLMPLFFGEVPIIFWLMIWGVRLRSEAGPRPAAT